MEHPDKGCCMLMPVHWMSGNMPSGHSPEVSESRNSGSSHSGQPCRRCERTLSIALCALLGTLLPACLRLLLQRQLPAWLRQGAAMSSAPAAGAAAVWLMRNFARQQSRTLLQMLQKKSTRLCALLSSSLSPSRQGRPRSLNTEELQELPCM